MKYSNQKNYRDQLEIEVEKTINNLDLPFKDKKNILVHFFSNIKKAISNILSNKN